MARRLPRKDELKERAADGHSITKVEVSHIAYRESDVTGRGPIKGSSTATAQSMHDSQQNYVQAAGDTARKPAHEITQEDAAEVHKAELRSTSVWRLESSGC